MGWPRLNKSRQPTPGDQVCCVLDTNGPAWLRSAFGAMNIHRKILLLSTIFLHCIAFGIFVFCVHSGPPMGESEFSPWDLGIIISSVLGFILLPLLYIPI